MRVEIKCKGEINSDFPIIGIYIEHNKEEMELLGSPNYRIPKKVFYSIFTDKKGYEEIEEYRADEDLYLRDILNEYSTREFIKNKFPQGFKWKREYSRALANAVIKYIIKVLIEKIRIDNSGVVLNYDCLSLLKKVR